MKLPKKVYVRLAIESDGSEYLVASETPDGEDGEQVGIYELVEVKKRRITETLV